MHPHTYKIRFLLVHPNLDFAEAQKALSEIQGLNSSAFWKAGDDRISPFGEKLEGKRFDSRWGFSFENNKEWHKSEDLSAPDAIEKILEKLLPYKDIFNNLAKQGCRIELIVAISVESNTSEAFTPDLMRQLSDFDINLAVDLYPPGV